MSDYNPVIADLDAVLSKASVATVVDSANRKGASCSPHPNAVAAFCWQSGDESTTEWYPQGFTISADASPDGEYQGKTVVLISWYYSGSGDNKGVRVRAGLLGLNYSKDVQADWAKDIPGNISKGDANWPKIHADLAG